MANDEHIRQLMKGVAAWNAWRRENPDIQPDLRAADLTGADLRAADLRAARLTNVHLKDANLRSADLTGADLRGAHFREADLSAANLPGADLRGAVFLNVVFTSVDLTGCRIYGVSAWGLKLDGATQQDLVITRVNTDEPEITVDNIEVAQFLYLLLHNEKIRDVMDTVGKKAVLILGRFTDERKAVLRRTARGAS